MELYDEFENLVNSLRAEGIPYALCGGLAMAVHGLPRATIDVDLLIEESSLQEAKIVAKKSGFEVDVGLMEFRRGVIRLYRLTKLDPDKGDTITLDLVLVTPEIRDVWETRQVVKSGFGTLAVVSREGLIKLKSLRKSGQDQDDIRRLRGCSDED